MIKILDDIIPKHLQDFFELTSLGRTHIKDEVIHPMIEFRANYEPTAQEGDYCPLSFVHILKSSTRSSVYIENFGLIPQIVCDHLKWQLKDIVLARIFLSLPYNTELNHQKPHVDFPFDHTVVLYYINDADGDTVIYNENGTVIRNIRPKKGRVLVFDGRFYHSGGIPKQGPRAVVNFDILTKED